MHRTAANAVADRLAFADGLRAVAVMWVVLHHLYRGDHIPLLAERMPAFVVGAMDHGNLGVIVFFVLSGYVMALTTHALDVDGAAARRFLARRLVRLTPPLWASIAVGVLLILAESVLRPRTDKSISVGSVLAHMVYAQDLFGYRPINSVYWTLVIELQFYAVFALLAWSGDALRRRTGWSHARMLAASVSILVALPCALWPDAPSTPGLFLGAWYAFMLGVLVCWWSRAEPGAGAGLVVLAAAVFIGFASSLGAASVTALATAGALAAAHRMGAMHRWLDARWIQGIGLVSYSVYLFHTQVQGAAAFVIRKVLAPSLATDVVVAVALIALPLLVAWGAFLVIERPSIAWSRRVRVRSAVAPRGTPDNGAMPQA